MRKPSAFGGFKEPHLRHEMAVHACTDTIWYAEARADPRKHLPRFYAFADRAWNRDHTNQMTSQLKERVELVRKYYNLKSREEIKEKTGIDVVYEDLISEEDGKYWAELCKKDFRRLEKYQVLNIGEGHFMDESDEPDSEDEKQKQEGQEEERESVPLEGLLFHRGERGPHESGDRADDDEFDHNKFMEEMMKNI